jgi:hypothetical protein
MQFIEVLISSSSDTWGDSHELIARFYSSTRKPKIQRDNKKHDHRKNIARFSCNWVRYMTAVDDDICHAGRCCFSVQHTISWWFLVIINSPTPFDVLFMFLHIAEQILLFLTWHSQWDHIKSKENSLSDKIRIVSSYSYVLRSNYSVVAMSSILCFVVFELTASFYRHLLYSMLFLVSKGHSSNRLDERNNGIFVLSVNLHV